VARLDLAYPKWKLGAACARARFQRDLRRINALRAGQLPYQ
jgi:hypothetical protein